MEIFSFPEKNLRILVVDDTPENLKVVGTILKRAGFEVLVASDGEMGISIARAKHPALILLDIMMPGTDGYDVCQILKKDEKTRNIPIIFLTSLSETMSMVKGFQYGASDYITKPFNNLELLARVRTHAENRNNHEQIRILSMAVRQSASSILMTDTIGNIVFVNDQLLTVTEYEKNELIGQDFRILSSGTQSRDLYQEIWETITTGREWRGELHNMKKNGESYWVFATISSIKDETGNILYYMATEDDITEKKRIEEELFHRSVSDTLTDTYNRRTGMEILKELVYLSKRQEQPLTVCLIDLDNLKYVNDTYGYVQGDSYIISVCSAVRSSVRMSDTLVRVGGDEFLVIFPNCSMEKARQITDRLTDKLDEINLRENFSSAAGISYGFAEYDPADAPSHEALIGVAYDQMYECRSRNVKTKSPRNKFQG